MSISLEHRISLADMAGWAAHEAASRRDYELAGRLIHYRLALRDFSVERWEMLSGLDELMVYGTEFSNGDNHDLLDPIYERFHEWWKE